MAQSARDSRLETRTKRLKLTIGKRYYKKLDRGVSLIYRRTGDGFGTWSAKVALSGDRYALRSLGTADDFQSANGADVLTFNQAQRRAETLSATAKADAGLIVKPLTVAEASDRYLAWFREHRKSATGTEATIRTHILPTLGPKHVHALTTSELRQWLEGVAATPARIRSGRLAANRNYKATPKTAEEKRARRASANRILSVLKALLNRAFADEKVLDNSAWRRVKPFAKVGEARIRFLTDAEAMRLVNACPPDLRQLVAGALLTGARLGELIRLQVRDVDLSTAHIYISQSKSGRPRSIPLNPEGVALFREAVVGKTGDSLVFLRSDGRAWGVNHHVRPLAEACKSANVKPAIAFHELRHTYASHLAQAGVDLLTISKLLGHADTRVTARHYAHLADKTLAAAVTKLPSFATTERPLQSIPARAR